jgi:hypothetical protein
MLLTYFLLTRTDELNELNRLASESELTCRNSPNTRSRDKWVTRDLRNACSVELFLFRTLFFWTTQTNRR